VVSRSSCSDYGFATRPSAAPTGPDVLYFEEANPDFGNKRSSITPRNARLKRHSFRADFNTIALLPVNPQPERHCR
jgi:hypothetical protein